MLKFVFKNSLLYTFASQIPMFANLLLYPIISEYLVKFDYFVFGTAMGYIGLTSMFADLGMTPLFQNSFFKKEKHYPLYWSHYLGFLILYKFIYGLIVTAMLYFVFRDDLPMDKLWLIIGLTVFPMVTFDITRGIGMRLMQFKHQHRTVHISTAIGGVFTVITTFITIYVYKMGYLGFFISNFVSVIIQGVFFAYIIYVKENILPTFRIQGRRVKEWLKFSIPIIPHNFSGYLLSSSDRVVLDQYNGLSNVSTSTIGMYNVAYNFASYFNHFGGQINTVISPIYFTLFRDKDPDVHFLIRRFTFLWLGFTFVVATLAGLWSKEVFQFFFINNTDGLAESYKYTIFLFMAFCYRPLYVASVEFVIFNERTTSLFKITTVAGILNVILNLILVPFFGIESAIFATFVCYMYMGISGHLFRDTKQYLPLSYYPIPVFIVICLTGFMVYYAVELSWEWKALITAAIAFAALLYYRKSGKEAIKKIQQVKVA